MIEKRSNWEYRVDTLKRYFFWHTTFGHEENLFIAEYPKSGGTWLCQLLSEILNIPFPRNVSLEIQPCILHGHFLSHKKGRRTIHMMRDGRDVIISAYFYFLIGKTVSPKTREKWITHMGEKKDLENISSHLPKFIEKFFENYRSGFKRKKWSDFIEYYHEKDEVYQVKYEDLHCDTSGTLMKLLDFLNLEFQEKSIDTAIEKYDFKSQKNNNDQENDFLRKGIIGDWKNYFNEESAKVFDLYCGDALIKAGYEKDRNWY